MLGVFDATCRIIIQFNEAGSFIGGGNQNTSRKWLSRNQTDNFSVIGTDCIEIDQINYYHMITTTIVPYNKCIQQKTHTIHTFFY